jgi:Flp pilus assembly pilin Flp
MCFPETTWHATRRGVVHKATEPRRVVPELFRREERESQMNKMLKKVRGASMVEYALLLVAILLLAAAAFKNLGPKVGGAATRSGGQL